MHKLLSNFINSNKKEKKLTTFLNPYSYILARQEVKLLENFNIEVDGIALVMILRFFNIICVQRKSFDMTSLAPIVFNNAVEESKSVYFIGAERGVIDQAIVNIRSRYPKLNVIGFKHGYFNNQKERFQVLKNINKMNPEIVVCGMGTPLQENFLFDLQSLGWTGLGYTCGGFLHQTAKGIEYYPKWIDKYNLRWIYRIYDEPKLLFRYIIDYPKFLGLFLYDYLELKSLK